MSKKKLSLSQTEPAAIRGVVVAVLTVLAALGVTWAADVSKETLTAIVIVAGSVIPLVQAVWTRASTTSAELVVSKVTPDRRVVAGAAAVEPTGTEVDQPNTRPDHLAGTGDAPVIASAVVKPSLLEVDVEAAT